MKVPEHRLMTAYGSALEDFTWRRRRAIKKLYAAERKKNDGKPFPVNFQAAQLVLHRRNTDRRNKPIPDPVQPAHEVLKECR